MANDTVKRNIVWNTCYQLFLVVSPLITVPYISRTLGVNGIGAYSYASSYQFFLALFAILGTSAYGMRTIAQARDDKEEYSRLFWEIEIMTIISSAICLCIWGIVIAFASKYKLLYIILTLNLITCMLDISWFYAGMEMFRYNVVKNAVCRSLGIILQFALVKDESDLYKYAAIMMGMGFLGAVTLWLPMRKLVVWRKINSLNLKKHLLQTIVYFIPSIAASVYTLVDKILLGLIAASEQENGYYEQATKIINALKAMTFASLNTVLGSRISYLFAKKEYEQIKARIKVSLDYILYLGIGMCFGIIAVADVFVPIFFGKQYMGVISVIKMMAPLIVIIGLSNCLGSHYYTPSGRRRESAVYIVVGAIINVVLNIILIPEFKSIGAVIATLVGELVITLLYFLNSKGYVDYSAFISQIIKKIIAASVMYWILIVLGRIIETNIQTLVIMVILGVIIYSIVLHILGDSMQLYFEKLLRRPKK